MNSRQKILDKLRTAQVPFSDAPAAPEPYCPVVPLEDVSPAALLQRFTEEAEKLSSKVYLPADEAAACEQIVTLLGDDKQFLNWEFEQIPLSGLAEGLANAGITPAEPGDPAVRVGITGVNAALAATGSLVYVSGAGKHRLASLLPPVHIAVVKAEQILPDFENWIALQREGGLEPFKGHGNTVIVSGPSRTADIAMEVILGVHGPAEIHIVII